MLADKNKAMIARNIAQGKERRKAEQAKEQAFIGVLQGNIDKLQFSLLELLEGWEEKLNEVSNLSMYVPVGDSADMDTDSDMSDSYGESGNADDVDGIFNLWGLVDADTAINIELNKEYGRISNAIRDCYRDIALLRNPVFDEGDYNESNVNPYDGFRLIPAIGLRSWAQYHTQTGDVDMIRNVAGELVRAKPVVYHKYKIGSDDVVEHTLRINPNRPDYRSSWASVAEQDDNFGEDIRPFTLWQARNSDNPAIEDRYWEGVSYSRDGSYDYPSLGYWELESLAAQDYNREMSRSFDGARLHPIQDREHFDWYLDYQRLRCDEITNRNLRKANPSLRESLPESKGYSGNGRERPVRKYQATDWVREERKDTVQATTLLESGCDVGQIAYGLASLLKAGKTASEAIDATLGKAFKGKVFNGGEAIIRYGDSLEIAVKNDGNLGVKVDGKFKRIEGNQFERRKAFRNLLQAIIDKWVEHTGNTQDKLAKLEMARQERQNAVPTDYERYGTHKQGEKHWYAGKHMVQRNLYLESDEGFRTTRIQIFAQGTVEMVTADVEPCGCGGTMVAREGKYGTFYGCDTFPKCRETRTADKVRETVPHEKVVRGTLLESYTINGWHDESPDVIAIPEDRYGRNPERGS